MSPRERDENTYYVLHPRPLENRQTARGNACARRTINISLRVNNGSIPLRRALLREQERLSSGAHIKLTFSGNKFLANNKRERETNAKEFVCWIFAAGAFQMRASKKGDKTLRGWMNESEWLQWCVQRKYWRALHPVASWQNGNPPSSEEEKPFVRHERTRSVFAGSVINWLDSGVSLELWDQNINYLIFINFNFKMFLFLQLQHIHTSMNTKKVHSIWQKSKNTIIQ